MLILASASPRRRELLEQARFSFTVQAASIDESRLAGEDGIRLATRLAREKAEAVFDSIATARADAGPAAKEAPLLVLGADTVIVCPVETQGEVILGKPTDARDAERMLALLSGRTHQVMTGVALLSGPIGGFVSGSSAAAPGSSSASSRVTEVACEVTHVTVRTLSAEEIAAYVRSGDPMDKAGAYGIQGYAGRWIQRIGGCYFNVVGLPLALVAAMVEGAEQRWAYQAPAKGGSEA